MEHWRTHVTHLGPPSSSAAFRSMENMRDRETCRIYAVAMMWFQQFNEISMGLNGISMGFLWVLTGFLWDLANNNGDLMKFNENIPSSYQPWQLEILWKKIGVNENINHGFSSKPCLIAGTHVPCAPEPGESAALLRQAFTGGRSLQWDLHPAAWRRPILGLMGYGMIWIWKGS